MMTNVSRRAFLKKVAMGLVAFVPAAQVLAYGNSRDNQPVQSPDPDLVGNPDTQFPPPPPPNLASLVIEKYESGIVVTHSPDQILVNTRHHGDVVLHLSSMSDVWKGRWVKDIPVEVGDDVRAWGQRRADGSIDVEKLWVNIVNLLGPVSNVKKDAEGLQLHCRDRLRGSLPVKIVRQTRIGLSDKPIEPLGDNVVDLREGQSVQIIGRQLKNGLVLATTLLLD